jgi:uncharacterized protein
MFGLGLAELQRAGSLKLQRVIPEDDPLWADAELGLEGPVSLDLVAKMTPTGQVLVTGTVEAPLLRECRRCLAPVHLTLRSDVAMVWTEPGELGVDPDDDGEGVRVLEAGAGEVDLGEAIREEMILAAPTFVLCREDCKGLCPRCGADLNEGPCGCVDDDRDPRWDALRALTRK